MREADLDYFKRRACEEREAASRGISEASRRRHAELARRYEAVAAALAAAGDVGEAERRAVIARTSIAAERDAGLANCAAGD